ncbi:thiol peroxidase [Holophaga foetida]|uniref:thiol peroxidase n=1 Tax=Holophaga foetida TaxID=35839 RepID=UPI0002474303|nr:thiol peroxidase [Holophaga foetida]
MATTALQGHPVHTCGELPQLGSPAPDFTVVKPDLSECTLGDLKGQKVVINIFPSVDTPVCAASVRRFNVEAAGRENTVVLCLSRDLPFAGARFCAAEGLDKVVTVSDFRNAGFAQAYGTLLVDGPLAGLHARAVVVVGEDGLVKHTELVADITSEPNYESALAAL